jgi:dipeptidyl aminopeptidase/acylaminoacyl peptidase
VSSAGGKPTAVPVIDSTARYFYPFALPGGTSVLVRFLSGGTSSLGQARIGALDLATGRVDSLGFGSNAKYADGTLFFAGADGTLMVQPFDAAGRKTTGPSSAILSGVALNGNSQHTFAVSEGGWLEYQMGLGNVSEKLGMLGPAGVAQIAIPGRSPEDFEDVSVSPDGRRIAVTSVSRDGSGEIWLLDQQNGTFDRLTVGGGWAATWSRDGQRIAYSSGPPYEIYVRAVDEAGSPQKVLAGKNLYPTSWIPGDRTIVFNADNTNSGTRWDIGTITIGDTLPRWLARSEFMEYQPQVSHDGRWLAYTSNRTGRMEVYVQPISGDAAPVQVSAEGGESPRWSREGRTLYYVATGRTLVGATLAMGTRVEVTARKSLANAGVIEDLNIWSVNWDVFPDGKRFLFVDRGGVDGGRPRMVLIQNWKELARQTGSKK